MVKLSELNKNLYRPGEAAKMLGIVVKTVQRYCDNGSLKVTYTDTGRRMITRESLVDYLRRHGLLEENSTRIDVVYARVSTHKQKQRGDLARQEESVKAFASDKNPVSLEVIADVGSGLNDNRKGLKKLINMVLDGKVNRIFVKYKDRLTRFGFNYLNEMCVHEGTEIVVVSEETDSKSVSEELAEDIVSIIHSFSGKLNGMRKTVKDNVNKELDAVHEETGNENNYICFAC